MRPALVRLTVILFYLFFLSGLLAAQINTGLNGTVINLPCNQTCLTQAFQPFRIPHLKTTSDYNVVPVTYNPYPYVTTGGTEDPNIYNDDRYSPLFDLPFPFCFYDSLFTKVSVGSNGIITFDYNLANCPPVPPLTAAWNVANPIPFNSGLVTCDGTATNYPRAAIMGVFQDLDPRPGPTFPGVNSSPPDRKIEWRVEGTAPFRRFIVSYYKIGVYQTTACGLTTPAIFQIVIYESTGVIDVFVENKTCNATSPNGSRAILGIQNYNRDKGLAAPGKNATTWTSSNEGYRFVPSGPVSRFVRCELQTLTGTTIVQGDTTTTTPGLLDVFFPDFCQTTAVGQYVIKSVYASCDNPATNEIASYDTITVNKTSSLNATGAATQTACGLTGTGTASITVPAGIGTAPYTFVLSPGGATLTGSSPQQFTGLTAGNYTINVTDASGGCSSAVPITVTSTGILNVTYNVTSTTCVGAVNGSITVNPPVGTPPFTYSFNAGPFTSNNNFTGLAPGIYFISTQDAAGCQANFIPVTVLAGTAITMTTAVNPTSCPGASNGSITVTGSSGTAPFQYSINGLPYQPGNTFNNLAPGTYFISLIDANGCTISFAPVTVNQGTGTVTGNAVPAPTTCLGVNDGNIVVNPTSGSGPYEYSINNGATWQTSNTFTGLAPGSYNFLIREAGLCTSATIPATITAGNGLNWSLGTNPTTCATSNNGIIVATALDGTAPFTFVLDGAVTQISATNSTSFYNLFAGPHTVSITDANGCININQPATIIIPAGTGFTATFIPTPTGCAGASNGKLEITAQNPGTAPFSAVLNPGGITQTSATSIITFNNLATGTYSAVITDANGCQFTLNNMTVVSGNALNASPATISTTCNGAGNGSINVTPATNGTAPYLYSLNGGSPQASPSFNGLTSGSYTIEVTDAGGCSSGNLTVTINAGPSISGTLSKVDATCFGSATGSITAMPSANATAPVQYSLDNITWQTSPDFPGLTANAYTVYIRDAVGCSNSANITIDQPVQLQAATSQQAVLCYSGNNGKIIVAATGGTSPYSYSLDNIVFQAGNIFNVTAGSYNVYVRDANGCTIPAITNVNVTEPALLTAAAVTTNATCDGGNDGTINISPAGGLSPYQYALAGGTFQPANNFNVAPGTHDITVQDVNGCTYTVAGIVVGLTNNLIYTPMIDAAPVCEGKTVSLQLVTNATQFAWTNSISLSGSNISNPVANPSVPTLYTVTATLGRCSITDDVFVPVIAAPIPFAGPEGDICYGRTYQLQGSGGVIYTWTPSDYLSSTSVSNPIVRPDKTIIYTLNVTDANGCESLVSDQVTVKVTPPIKVTTYPADTVVYGGVQIPLLATSVGTDYVWSSLSGTAGLNNPNIANPIATAPVIDGSVVKYDVKATTSAGCDGWGSVTIKVYKGPDIYVANVFSPNGDGKNELFIPFPVGIKQMNYFRIFNRWGQMVFSTTTLYKGWDGRLSGIEQPTGVYVWMAQGITIDNKIITKQGTVTLVR